MKLFDLGLTIFIIVVAGIFLQGGYAIAKSAPDSHNVADGFVS